MSSENWRNFHVNRFDWLTNDDMINLMRCAQLRLTQKYRDNLGEVSNEYHIGELTTMALWANKLSKNLEWLP